MRRIGVGAEGLVMGELVQYEGVLHQRSNDFDYIQPSP
jgi:hypothetical protein